MNQEQFKASMLGKCRPRICLFITVTKQHYQKRYYKPEAIPPKKRSAQQPPKNPQQINKKT
jgi:hypothetical protein